MRGVCLFDIRPLSNYVQASDDNGGESCRYTISYHSRTAIPHLVIRNTLFQCIFIINQKFLHFYSGR